MARLHRGIATTVLDGLLQLGGDLLRLSGRTASPEAMSSRSCGQRRRPLRKVSDKRPGGLPRRYWVVAGARPNISHAW
jgi:hypothetical protein